ncbi:glycoside hydrolase [Niabella sp.]|uniref:glycoside hydrolase n=1 Tax=Niabella sp. TaxID=1962976 RepID=UPI002612B382|nr:glycoside hydrolase [Niabella sp.]
MIKKIRFALLLIPVTGLLLAYGEQPGIPDMNLEHRDEKIIVTVDPAKEQQVIHSFGASDCWTAKFIGRWQDVQKKERIADLLFSMDTLKDGSPKGIGLSLWRFNIGGGSFEQGDSSHIKDEWRREECFLNADGSYSWDKQRGQQWFLQAARKRGVRYTLGFSQTPPVFMTQNGKAYNASGTTRMNIREGMMDAYAGFLANVTNHFKFDFLSPVNEPQWKWGTANGASQEGTQAVNTEIADLVRAIAPKIKGKHTKIVVGEAGQWNYLFGKNEQGCGDQINQFFTPAAPAYIGGLPAVAPVISGHSYFTTCPDTVAVRIRQQVQTAAARVASLQVWQTEFGILGNICNQYNGAPRNTGIEYGLYVADVMHQDLTVANVSSWQWWLAMAPYDYSDALVYINAPSGKIDVPGSKADGVVTDSKQLWVMGNFARFVRPGMKRIAASLSGSADGVMVSAYKDTKKMVLVLINPQHQAKNITLNGFNDQLVDVYTTDQTRNLKRSVARAGNMQLPARSVVTVTGTYRR